MFYNNKWGYITPLTCGVVLYTMEKGGYALFIEMKKFICNIIGRITFGRVCFGWCKVGNGLVVPEKEYKPTRLVYTKNK